MSSSTPPHTGRPLGISLQGLLALVDAHGGRGEFEGKSTDWVKLHVVLPSTFSSKTSYVAPLAATGSPHVAPASAFISHAYADEFLGVVDSVAALEAKEGSSAFYYFDLLVVNQHSQSLVPFEVLRDEFGCSVKAIGRTLLVLRWADPKPLQRAWCVFELATTLAVGASLQVLMPPVDAAAFEEALKGDFDSLTYKTCRVDVEKAKARESADLDNIKRVIKEAGGFLETNQLVIKAMKSWMVREGQNTLTTAKEASEKAALMNNLAILLSDQGKLGEAEPLHREVLSWRRLSLGNEHPSTLGSLNNLANLLRVQGRLAEAEPLYLKALAGFRRMLGNEHPDTLRSINNLALLLSDKVDMSAVTTVAQFLNAKRKLDEVKVLYLEVLAARRRTLGKEHPDTLDSINNLAGLLHIQEKLGEAEPLHREALAAYRRTLGNEHPSTLRSINNLALLLRDQGKLSEAEPLYLEALAAYRRTLGNDHPETLNSIYNYAGLLLKQGKRYEALEQFRIELEGVRRVLGENHPSTQQSLRSYQKLKGESSKCCEIC